MKKSILALSIGMFGALALGNGIDVILTPAQIMTAVETYEAQLAEGELDLPGKVSPKTIDRLDSFFVAKDKPVSTNLHSIEFEDYYMLRVLAEHSQGSLAETQILSAKWNYVLDFDPETQLIYLTNTDGLIIAIQPLLIEDLDELEIEVLEN